MSELPEELVDRIKGIIGDSKKIRDSELLVQMLFAYSEQLPGLQFLGITPSERRAAQVEVINSSPYAA